MSMQSDDLKRRMKNIRIIFMDVDGVLTDGSAIFIGEESPKIWNVRDRLALKALKTLLGDSITVIWISGRPSSELEARASELGVDRAYSGIADKYDIMKRELSSRGLSPSEALYIGDDLVDLRCMEYAGVSCAPSDAASEALEEADYISDYPGGRGAVRQIIELLLKSAGRWDELVGKYRRDGGLN